MFDQKNTSIKAIELNNECLKVGRNQEYMWSDITKVSDGILEFVIWINKTPVLIAPKSGFASEADKDKFVSLVEAARIGKLGSITVVPENETWPPAPKVTV